MNETVTLKISTLIKILKEYRNDGCKYVNLSILEGGIDEDDGEPFPPSLSIEGYEDEDDDIFYEETLDSIK